MVTPKRKQVKLIDSYKKVAKDDVRRDAAAGKCAVMSEQDMAARQWELAEQHRAWLEALEHENLITYRKQAGTVTGQDDMEREMSLESKSDWSAEGDKFYRIIAQQQFTDSHFKFPTWVTADLANIVYNHGKHSVPDVSQNAFRTLMLILEKQPPVSVRAGPVDIEGPKSRTPPPLVLLTPPSELEPWVGLPGGRSVGNEQTAAQAFGKSLRSASKRVATRSKPAKYGVHWLVEEVPKWVELLESLHLKSLKEADAPTEGEEDDPPAEPASPAKEPSATAGKADGPIESAWGSVWLMQYLLQAWQKDLDARVQVVQSHSSNPAQQKQSQQMLTVSYVHRALEDVAGSQAQALLDKCWNMVAMLSPSSASVGRTWSGEAEGLAQGMRETVQHFLRLVYTLLGVAEDIGLSLTSTAFCQCAMKRQTLDAWMLRVFHYARSPREWSGLLYTLAPRDRMRFLSVFLSHRYHLMGFSTRDVAKHAAEAFEQPGECFASDGTDSPATFVDVSPGTTMHVLTTGDMLSRFYKAATAFKLDCNAICTFVHHLCESALQVLPRVVSENRFRIVRARRAKDSKASEVVLEPLQKMPKCYLDTHSRFDKVHALTASDQREACRAEIMTMQRGVNKVVLFLEKLAHKGELAEEMHVEDCKNDGGLHLEMLSTALAAGTITRHSAMLLVSANRRLARALK